MTLAADAAWTLLRAILVASCAVALAAQLTPALRAARGRRAFVGWAILLAPWLTPALFQSFVYRTLAPGVRPQSFSAELAYAVLLLIRHIPIATALFCLVPSPLSAEALHCHRLFVRGTVFNRLHFRIRAAGGGALLVFSLLVLLSFQEFELASFANVRSWTVRLFDAHAGGLELRETLRLIAVPLAVQVALLVCALGAAPRPPVREFRPQNFPRFFLSAYLVLAACVATLIPAGAMLCKALPGWPSFFAHPRLTAEMTHSSLFAAAAAATALVLAAGLVARRPLAITCCVPGLFGALVLALALLAFFQQPLLRPLRDSPIPLLVALILLVLPMAVLLEFFLGSIRRTAEVYLARQCHARHLLWQLEGRCTYAAFVLIFCAAFFEFTAGALLAPAGSTPIFVRLHNLAHYGSTAVLAATMCAALTPPILLCALVPVVRRVQLLRG